MRVTSKVNVLRVVIMLIAGAISQQVWAASPNPLDTLNHPVPGGVAVIPIESSRPPGAKFQGKQVLIVPTGPGLWVALVGIPLSTPAQPQTLDVQTSQGARTLSFSVQDKKYKEQRITLKNTRQVNPLPEDLKRIEIELKEQSQAYQQFSAGQPSNVLFDKPVDGPLSSSFGLRRFFNGEPRAPHSGADFPVPTGTPVRAPAAGRVILVGNYFFNGQTVFVDHGQGLISMFCHLSVLDVKPGDSLLRGQTLGKVGATGRVTGAHLHWNVSLNDARVDPAIFIGAFKP